MIGGGILIVVIFIQIFAPHFLPAIFTTIARPFWRMEFSVASGSLNSPAALLAQNQVLKLQLQEIMSEDISADVVRAQNAELMSLFGRVVANPSISSGTSSATISTSSLATSSDVSTSPTYKMADVVNNGRVLAAVLVRPPLAPYDEFVIDAGSNEGIAVGAKVYAPGNILIGNATDVMSESAKVTLLSSPGQNYPVIIGPNHISTIAIGRGGGQYEAQIPQATAVAVGDAVTDTSLSDGVFGKVISVLNNPADPFETVLFAPSINVYQLRFVLVEPSNSLNIVNITKPVVPVKPTTKSTSSTSTKVKK